MTMKKISIAIVVAITAGVTTSGAGSWTTTQGKTEPNPVTTQTVEQTDVSREASVLAQGLQGPAHWPPLDIAATRDPGLLEALRALAVESRRESVQALRERVKQIFVRWAGAHDAHASGRGLAMDGRHLAAVEAWRGKALPENGEWGSDPTAVQAIGLEGEFQNRVDWTAKRLLGGIVETEEILRAWEEGETILSEGRMWSHRLVIVGYTHENDVLQRNREAAVRDAVALVRIARQSTPQTAITLDEVKLILRLRQVELEKPDMRYARPLLGVYGLSEDETARAIEWITTPHANRVDGTEGPDRMEGSAWNDVLRGKGGDDTYVWEPGEGNDVVSEALEGGGVDTLVIENVKPHEVDVRKMEKPGHEHDRQIIIRRTGEWIVLFGQTRALSSRIEKVRFDDGTVWNSQTIEAHTG